MNWQSVSETENKKNIYNEKIMILVVVFFFDIQYIDVIRNRKVFIDVFHCNLKIYWVFDVLHVFVFVEKVFFVVVFHLVIDDLWLWIVKINVNFEIFNCLLFLIIRNCLLFIRKKIDMIFEIVIFEIENEFHVSHFAVFWIVIENEIFRLKSLNLMLNWIDDIEKKFLYLIIVVKWL